MGKIIKRLIDLNLPPGRSAFLWGARKVGKSFWLHKHFPQAVILDLLETDTFGEYAARPALLRERFLNHKGLIIIDEVQKIPALLDEVHWLIERKHQSFLLTGSSARKLRRGHANLLGGRAWRRVMVPLSFIEVEHFHLSQAITAGLLPGHYLSGNPVEELRAYVMDYLKEEIAAEALVQNIPAFSEFLRVAAMTSSELVNYTNMARETGISAKVVRSYFQILEDTYLGYRLPPWKKSKNRRMILTEKFYLFDVGVTNFLAGRHPQIGNADFGKAFEQFILMELKAYQAYRLPEMPITYWRTSSGQEVDFILGDKEVAIEVKSGRVHDGDLKGMHALLEDGPIKKHLFVSTDSSHRTLGHGIEVWPWQEFLTALWAGKII